MNNPFENTKKEGRRTGRFMNLEKAVCKVYLNSSINEKEIMDRADHSGMGIMRANLVSVGGHEKGFTRSLVFAQKELDMLSKDGFKGILGEGETVVKVHTDLSNNIETSRNMQTSKYKEITQEKESIMTL